MKPIILLSLSLLFSVHAYSKVYFSPESILDKVVVKEVIKAVRSIDMAIYTFNSPDIREAILQKLSDNVQVRILTHRGKTDSTKRFVLSLQQSGAHVRYVSKINHHKFLITDGKRIYSSSGNFSQTKRQRSYDENSFVCEEECPHIVDAFQQEFDWLWVFSKEVGNEHPMESLPLARSRSVSDQAFFTSFNFSPYIRRQGVSFRSSKDEGLVEESLVRVIQSAQKNIKIATGHFRSYPLYLALKEAAAKGVKITLVLDSQEYISSQWEEIEDEKIQECLDKGKSKKFCHRQSVHFSRKASRAGIDVRIKYYAFKWFFLKAPQMHHKYLIVDDQKVYTGSYNWSFNAEYNTFENVARLDRPSDVKAYLNNFNRVLSYGAEESFQNFLSQFKKPNRVPLFFSPRISKISEIDQIRDLIYKNCPQVGLLEAGESSCH
jgi:phosphatidylserine/phosphatidylglycerophosphate/cardiolipin synthase-like enzyme